MGTICHHAIVVTTWSKGYAQKAHEEAVKCCGAKLVTALTSEATNGYRSFMIAPDGSKEGWEESNHGEAQRSAFIAWLEGQRWRDGSTPYSWVLIEYGERFQREGAVIIKHAWEVNISDSYAGPHELDSEEAP